jgi:hypothetical protein
MKKFSAIVATAALVLSLTACGGASDAGTPATDASNTGVDAAADNTADAGDATVNTDTTDDGAQNVDADVDMEGVMTYAEYAAAELDSEVVVETYVQAKQSWWENKATIYTQDADGGYFIYELPCTEDEYNKLVPGTKIKVTGYKSEWSGEVEIVDATYEIESGDTYVAKAQDVTGLLGKDELVVDDELAELQFLAYLSSLQYWLLGNATEVTVLEGYVIYGNGILKTVEHDAIL